MVMICYEGWKGSQYPWHGLEYAFQMTVFGPVYYAVMGLLLLS